MAILELGRDRPHEPGASGHRAQHHRAAAAGGARRRQGDVDSTAPRQEQRGEAFARIATGFELAQDEPRHANIAVRERVVDQRRGDRSQPDQLGVGCERIELHPTLGHGFGTRIGEQTVELGVVEPLEAGDGGGRETGQGAPDGAPAAQPRDPHGGSRGHDYFHSN